MAVEAKLLVGRFLDFNRGPGRIRQATSPQFETLAIGPLQISESTRKDPGGKYNPFRNVGGQRQSTVVAGANANKAHRNFKWLPWYEGDIAETLLNYDVLTGPMSGCCLVTYRKVHGGPLYAGHIGTVTVSESSPASINDNVKNLFKQAIINGTIRDVRGFIPTANTVPAHPPAVPGDVKGETFGLMTTIGDFFAVNVYIQNNDMNCYRVAGVHQVQTMTLAQLQNI
jgi:hypothetical protein